MRKRDQTYYLLLVVITLAVVGLIGTLIYGGEHGWFKDNNQYNTFINQTTLERLQLPPTGTCSITFSQNPVCAGQPVTGTAQGRANDVCNLYYSTNGGGTWLPDAALETFHLNSAGFFSASRVAEVPANYLFKMLCANDCIATAPLTIRVCDLPPETDCTDSDGGTFPLLFGICNDGSAPPSPDVCSSPVIVAEQYCSPSGASCAMTLIACPVGAICSGGVCVPTDGVPPDGGSADGVDYGGYSSCSAWAAIEGKEFSDDVSGITSLAMCEAYADSECKKINPSWWVSRLDFDTPDCCIWDCSGSWN